MKYESMVILYNPLMFFCHIINLIIYMYFYSLDIGLYIRCLPNIFSIQNMKIVFIGHDAWAIKHDFKLIYS